MWSSKVLQVYQKPFHYDDMGQFIFDANSKMVAQVRGWWDIKYQDDPAELQDAIGTEIVWLLNKIPDGKIETTVNMNGMRKSMVQNFNRIAGQLARENVKDQRLARYLEDLRSDISMFLCIYEPDDPLFSDMSDKLQLDSVDPIYEEVPWDE